MINIILGLLRNDAFITVNKELCKSIGFISAGLFCELAARYNYFYSKNQLKDGYFYCTVETIKNEIGLSKEEQETAFRKLVKFGLIDKKVAKLKGDEAPKRYIKITNDQKLLLSLLGSKDMNSPKNILESIENTGKEGIPLFENSESHFSKIVIPTFTKISNAASIATLEPQLEDIRIRNKINKKEENQSVSPSSTIGLEKRAERKKEKTDKLTYNLSAYKKIEEPKMHISIDQIKEQVEYPLLIESGLNKHAVDEILLNVLDMYYSDFIVIGGSRKPKEILESMLSKLRFRHIEFVLKRIDNVTTKIKNKKDYVRTAIYNSVFEIETHYTAEFNYEKNENKDW